METVDQLSQIINRCLATLEISGLYPVECIIDFQNAKPPYDTFEDVRKEVVNGTVEIYLDVFCLLSENIWRDLYINQEAEALFDVMNVKIEDLSAYLQEKKDR